MRYDGMVAISPEASDFYKVPVYLRPERPVVLPERRTGDSAAWNTCLDAVEELKK